jgi:competence protein ComEA
MTSAKNNDYAAGGLLLLFFLLSIFLTKSFLSTRLPVQDRGEEKVFIGVEGDVRFPGTYGFNRSPDLQRLIERAGGLSRNAHGVFPLNGDFYENGDNVCIKIRGEALSLTRNSIPAAHKLTLGIPISINNETVEGLTAVPGIGPKTAAAIVKEREKRIRFRSVEDLLLVPGMGPSLLQRVRPYLSP